MQNEPQTTRQTVDTTEVADDRPVRRNYGVYKVAQIVWFITGFIVVLLLVRFILALLGANLENGFASLVYMLSEPFVAPFRGLLQIGQFQAGVSRFEIETLLASLVYLLIGWGITKAVKLASR